MTCRDCADFLSDYLAGELAPDVRARFDEHLARCPNCVTYLAQFETTIRAGRQAFADEGADAGAEVPDALVRAILAARRGGQS